LCWRRGFVVGLVFDIFGSDNSEPLQRQKLHYYNRYILPFLQSKLSQQQQQQQPARITNQNQPNQQQIPFSNTIDLITSTLPLTTPYSELDHDLTTRQRLLWASTGQSAQKLQNAEKSSKSTLNDPLGGSNSSFGEICYDEYSEEDEDDEDQGETKDQNPENSKLSLNLTHPTSSRRRQTSVTVRTLNDANNNNKNPISASKINNIGNVHDLHLLLRPPNCMALISPLDQFDIPATVTPTINTTNLQNQHIPQNQQKPSIVPTTPTLTTTQSSALQNQPQQHHQNQHNQLTQQKPHSITEYIIFITNIGIEAQAVSSTALTRLQTIAFSIEDFWFDSRGQFLLCSTPSKVLHLIQIVYNLPQQLSSILLSNDLLGSNQQTNNTRSSINPSSSVTSTTTKGDANPSPIDFIRVTKFEIEENSNQNQQNTANQTLNNDIDDEKTSKLKALKDDELIQLGFPSVFLRTHLQQDVSNVIHVSPSLNLLQYQHDPKLIIEKKLFLPPNINNTTNSSSPNQLEDDSFTPLNQTGGLFGMNMSLINGQLSTPHSNSLISNSKLTTNPLDELYGYKNNSPRGYRLSLLTIYHRLYISLHDEHSGALLLFTLGDQGILSQTHTFQTACRGRCIVSVKHNLINIVQINGDLISYEQYFYNSGHLKENLQKLTKKQQESIDMAYIASRCCIIDIKNTGSASMTHQWIILNALHQEEKMDEMINHQTPLVQRQIHTRTRLTHLLGDYQPQNTYTLSPMKRTTAQSNLYPKITNQQNQQQNQLSTSNHNNDETIGSTYVFYPPCYLLVTNNNAKMGTLSIITPNYYNMLKQAHYIQYQFLLNLFSHRSPIICKYYHLLIIRTMIMTEGFLKQSVLYQNLIEFKANYNTHLTSTVTTDVPSEIQQNEAKITHGQDLTNPNIQHNVTITDLSAVQDIIHDILDSSYHQFGPKTTPTAQNQQQSVQAPIFAPISTTP
jgi:hypothetical protein